MIEPNTVGRKLEKTRGLNLLREIVSNPENVVVPIGTCELTGFVYDMFTEHRAPSVRLEMPGGSIRTTAPSAGTYYFGFLLYDTEGDERFTVSIDDREVGIAVGNEDDNRLYLFMLSEPYTFRGGERIHLKTVGGPGLYRTEGLVFLKEKPRIRSRDRSLSRVAATPQGNGAQTSITWVTPEWASKGRVEYGLPEKYGAVAQEVARSCNHRVLLDGLEPGRTYHYRIVATDSEGETVTGEDHTFVAKAPCPPRGKVARSLVPLTVRGSNFPGGEVPITSGIPFPQGDLPHTDHVRVLDAEGGEIPSQVIPLALWPDETIQWALVDVQGREGTYALEYGTDVTRREYDSPLTVEETHERVTVRTGPLAFTVDRHRFGLLGDVRLDDEPIAEGSGGIYLTDDGGRTFVSLCPPEELIVEESGPLRAVIRAKGKHRAESGEELFSYIVRIHAYAGKSYLRVFHTFENTFAESEFVNVRSLVLRTPFVLGSERSYAFGGDRVLRGAIDRAMRVEWAQVRDDQYVIRQDEEEEGGCRAAGWLDLTDGRRGITVAVRNFWQLYPKTLAVEEDSLEVGLCPPLAPDQYAGEADKDDEHKLYFYLLHGRYRFRQGVSKTHELLYYFHHGDAEAAGAEEHARWLDAPPVAVAPGRWYCETRAFGDVFPAQESRFPAYETPARGAVDLYRERQESQRAYGTLNFGDWYGERRLNWGNNETDAGVSYALQFARDGDPRFLFAAEEVNAHYGDVDTIHFHRDPSRAGGVHSHSIGHTGGYYIESPKPGGTPWSRLSASHTWAEGLVYGYLLTGNRRDLETARKIADRFDTYKTIHYDFTNCRFPGWHLILNLAVYRVTNDPYHFNAAKIIVDRVLERQTPEGGWVRQLMPGHCHCVPRHRGNAGFMVGILLSGLKRYHQLTGEERVAQAIARGARFLIEDMWDPDACGFRYTSCPNTRGGPSFPLLEGIAYAYRLTKDAQFEDVLRASIRALLSRPGTAMHYGAMRSAPYVLHDIGDMEIE